MIFLDTDVLIEIFDKKSDKGDEALNKIVNSGQDIAITSLNLHEVLYGLYKYAKPVKDIFLLPVIDFTKKDASLSAEIEVKAERAGKLVRRIDAMIAAIVINRGASLYTFDSRHFAPLKPFGLKLFS